MSSFELDDCHVVLTDLPIGVRGSVAYDEEGFPTVFLNARYTREMNAKSFFHEARHILRDHAHSGLPLSMLEDDADAKLPPPILRGTTQAGPRARYIPMKGLRGTRTPPEDDLDHASRLSGILLAQAIERLNELRPAIYEGASCYDITRGGPTGDVPALKEALKDGFPPDTRVIRVPFDVGTALVFDANGLQGALMDDFAAVTLPTGSTIDIAYAHPIAVWRPMGRRRLWLR